MATTTTSQKRTAESRAESGDATVNTTLFVVGCTPYKETILLPRVETRITTSSVVQAIADQQAKPQSSSTGLLYGDKLHRWSPGGTV